MQTNKNGRLWYDTDGNPIQAHAGMILPWQGMYYWYGEHKNGATSLAPSGDIRVDFTGISCYSSCDCKEWKYEGIVLAASADPGSDLYKDRICERPKVLFNELTGKFVMWMHIDTADYTAARAGVAVADSPTGPFTYLRSILPNHCDCRDMTLFQDLDQTAYLIHSSDWNKTLRITKLNADYTEVTGLSAKAFIDQEREAPAVFLHEGLYYMITSGCTGWDPNSALYGVSTQMLGGWRLIDNPCCGADSRTTYHGQSSYVFRMNERLILMLDHWNPRDLSSSGYSFLPVEADGLTVTVPFRETFDPII